MVRKKEESSGQILGVKAQEGKAIIGTERVIKALQAGKLSQVFLASNCPAKVKEDIERFAGLAKVSIIELDIDNEEVGVLCKRNYFVSVAGIIGE